MTTSQPDYYGMTVNERLFVGGLIEDFDSAIEVHDRAAAIIVLAHVGLSDQAEEIVDSVLANPGFYGFPRVK